MLQIALANCELHWETVATPILRITASRDLSILQVPVTSLYGSTSLPVWGPHHRDGSSLL